MLAHKIQGYTIFCDDVRQEISGQTTYVGVYNGVINFSGSAPQTLPTFNMLISILAEPDIVLGDNLVVKVFAPGTEKAIMEISSDLDEAIAKKGEALTESQVMYLQIPVTFRNMKFLEKGVIKVRGYANGHEFKFGALAIAFQNVISHT